MKIDNAKLFNITLDESAALSDTTTLDIEDYQHVNDATVGYDVVNDDYYVAISINAPLDWPKTEVGNVTDYDIN